MRKNWFTFIIWIFLARHWFGDFSRFLKNAGISLKFFNVIMFSHETRELASHQVSTNALRVARFVDILCVLLWLLQYFFGTRQRREEQQKRSKTTTNGLLSQFSYIEYVFICVECRLLRSLLPSQSLLFPFLASRNSPNTLCFFYHSQIYFCCCCCCC